MKVEEFSGPRGAIWQKSVDQPAQIPRDGGPVDVGASENGGRGRRWGVDDSAALATKVAQGIYKHLDGEPLPPVPVQPRRCFCR